MIELPNSSWLRSTKMPEYALCLDPNDEFFGWKMKEYNNRWVSIEKLSLDEIKSVMKKQGCQSHLKQLKILYEEELKENNK